MAIVIFSAGRRAKAKRIFPENFRVGPRPEVKPSDKANNRMTRSHSKARDESRVA